MRPLSRGHQDVLSQKCDQKWLRMMLCFSIGLSRSKQKPSQTLPRIEMPLRLSVKKVSLFSRMAAFSLTRIIVKKEKMALLASAGTRHPWTSFILPRLNPRKTVMRMDGQSIKRSRISAIGLPVWILITSYGNQGGKTGSDSTASVVIATMCLLVWTNSDHLPSGMMRRTGQSRLGTAGSPNSRKSCQSWSRFCQRITLKRWTRKQVIVWKDWRRREFMISKPSGKRNLASLNNSSQLSSFWHEYLFIDKKKVAKCLAK